MKGHDGIRIAYATSGSGPVLLKPANWLTHLEYDWESPVWREFLTVLSQNNRLIRYDTRGTGMSDWNIPSMCFDDFVSDLEAVIDAMGDGRRWRTFSKQPAQLERPIEARQLRQHCDAARALEDSQCLRAGTLRELLFVGTLSIGVALGVGSTSVQNW